MSRKSWGEEIRLRIEQLSPALGSMSGNIARIRDLRDRAKGEAVDLLLTPELSLTGYDLRDRVHSLARTEAECAAEFADEGPDLVCGFVEQDGDFVPYNSALHLRAGRTLHRHRKVYLPTYGMFDEGRYFGAGDRIRAYEAGGGWRLGMLVCEDLWHPALTYVLAQDGVHLIMVQAAAAGRGSWEGGESGRFGSWDAWLHLARAAAIAHGVYVAVANRVGAEGSLVFAGGSFLVGPDGQMIARASDAREESLTATLSLREVARARRPFAHLRDEDPHLTIRELTRILDARVR